MKTFQTMFFFMMIPLLAWGQKAPSLFADNGYRPDSVVIDGQILNRTTHIPPSAKYTHLITGENIQVKANIDSLGNFSLKVPVFNTTNLAVDHVAYGFTIVLFAEPKENITITSDWKQDKVVFSGTRAEEHQQVFDYNLYLQSINTQHTPLDFPEQITDNEYLRKVKATKLQQDSLLNAYVKRTKKMSEKAIKEIQANNLNSIGYHLMQRQYNLDRRNGERFSETYTDYADSLFAALPQPYTTVNTAFLNNYLSYYNDITQRIPLQKALIEYAIQKKKITPNQEQLKDFNLIFEAEECNAPLAEAFKELMRTKKYQQLLFDLHTKAQLSTPMPDQLKELITTQAFYRYLRDNRIALSQANLDEYKQQVKSPELQKYVLDFHQKLSDLKNSKLDHKNSLKSASLFKDCQTGEEIFARLTKLYQGKIIYLDIWGTWCEPCRREMKYTRKIKEAMQDKDVVFIYMANRSPDISWKNIIKEMDVTGKQVAHYNLPTTQQLLLEKYLNVSHYPNYFIIDREGKVVEKHTKLRPSKGQELIDRLNKLLSE